MERVKQALIAFIRKGTKNEKSVPSCSGKISRTGEQYRCPWEILPEEIVVSIFKLLPNKDLLACRAVCKRFVLVIGESVLLDKSKAFWKQLSQPPDPELFGPERYKQVLRPWFEAFVTAQQRLAGCASGDLPFSHSKREATERQASPQQTEQIQFIKSSQVKRLDRLIEHREFTKALFFIQTKTLQNAESFYLQEMILHSCPAIVEAVCFSPDGRSLLTAFNNTVQFIVLDENGKVIRKYNKDYNFPVYGLRFSPNGRSLLICFNRSIMIMGPGGEDWVQKGETAMRPHYSQGKVCFSSDSDSLAAVLRDSIRIMERDEKGNWVQNSRIPYYHAKAVEFSPNGSSLVTSNGHTAWIMGRNMKGTWVQTSWIPCSTLALVQSACFSPDGCSLAISGRKGYHHPSSVLIMRSDVKGNWVKDFVIDSEFSCSACFSPDGRNLLLESFNFCIRHSRVIDLGRASSGDCKSEHFLHNEGAICFSPDGGSLATGFRNTTTVMGLDKGKWVDKARIPNTGKAKFWRVEAVCFSPDSRSLAILSSNGYSGLRKQKSQIKIYEIKTGAKVLTRCNNRFLKGFFSS